MATIAGRTAKEIEGKILATKDGRDFKKTWVVNSETGLDDVVLQMEQTGETLTQVIDRVDVIVNPNRFYIAQEPETLKNLLVIEMFLQFILDEESIVFYKERQLKNTLFRFESNPDQLFKTSQELITLLLQKGESKALELATQIITEYLPQNKERLFYPDEALLIGDIPAQIETFEFPTLQDYQQSTRDCYSQHVAGSEANAYGLAVTGVYPLED